MLQVDALGPGGAYRAIRRLPLHCVAGRSVGQLSLVPPLFVQRSLSALRDAQPLPPDERVVALARAGEAFAEGVVDGVSSQEYEYAVSRLSGLPIATVRMASQAIAGAARVAYQMAMYGRPVGAVADWRDPLTRPGSAVWTRRGEVLAVQAAGNHPAVHAQWLQALAVGFAVAVRPSQREPITPHRLIVSLRDAGFPNDHVALLPTDHAGADGFVRDADLSVVYGGDDVIRKYAGNTTVLAQGPGRSKILLTRDLDWTDHLDTVVDSICGQGGTTCLNTTAVFVDGDPAEVAQILAERMSALPSLPPEDEKAVLPVAPRSAAVAIANYLLDRAGEAKPWLGGDGIADDLGDGSAVLRPAVFQVDSPHAVQATIEMPFPCIWVAPWSPDDGPRPLRNTLVLTALTTDEQLIGRLVDEPTIRNIYLGAHPTHQSTFGLPHDGYFSEFLMHAKSVVRQ